MDETSLLPYREYHARRERELREQREELRQAVLERAREAIRALAAAAGISFAVIFLKDVAISGRCIPAVKEMTVMLRWALIFLILGLIAAAFGFTGIAGASVGIAKVLFFIFLAICVVMFILEQFGVRVRVVLPGRAPTTTRFAENGQEAQRFIVPEPYQDLAQKFFEDWAEADQPITHASDVAEAVWIAATDASSPMRIPAGADSVEWARAAAA